VQKKPFTSSEVIVLAGGGSAGRLQTAIHKHDEDGFKLPHGGGCC
jgi:carbon starvation protein